MSTFNKHRNYEEIIESSFLPAAILNAEGNRLVAANDAVFKAWHRTPEIIGSQLLDFMPELADQRYPKLLKYVIRSGRIWEEKQALVSITRSGRKEIIPTDYSYTPIFGFNGRTVAVLVLGHFSEKDFTSLSEQANQQALINIVQHSDAGMCIYRGPNFEVEAINEQMLKFWNGKPRRHLEVLNHVYFNGMPYSLNEHRINYHYMPLIPDQKGPTGVYVVARFD